MTDETQKLFNAPWRALPTTARSWAVYNSDGSRNIDYLPKPDANRLARLPELYEALMYFVVNDCPHAFISNDECRLCPDKKCKTREAVELLRKVRDGE